MIPHIIHYCWFGGNKKTDVIIKCIESWKKHFPGWKIIEWNESNYDINKCQYVRDAYILKKWAFVSDYARFDVLKQYGGIYLDVDVEFIKDLPEEYLNLNCFSGFQGTGEVSPGLIFATVPNHWLCKLLLEDYSNDRFFLNEKGYYKTVNIRTSQILSEYGLIQNNKLQILEDVYIFPSEYFCGYNTDIREPEITQNTICWHHYLGSWSKKTVKRQIQDTLKIVIGINNYKKILNIIRKVKKYKG